MIIANLKGGLGNQMFQYALGRTLALKNNDVLKLDTGSLSKAEVLGNIYRPFDLEFFAIEKAIATPDEIQAVHYPFGVMFKLLDILKRKILRQSHVVFEPNILDLNGDIYLDGYFQSPRYFESIRETLLKDFTLREPLSPSGQVLAAQIKSTTAASLHVRRGDYVANKRVLKENGVCSPAYYYKAVEKITTTVINPTFFVFSDDMSWVKENLQLPKGTVFVSDTSLYAPQELYLMSLCQHNIIANSSFSWWAAWLNQNPDKVVIAPTPWFNTIAYDKDLIPESWIQLNK
jgi:hypothetical protein